MTEEIETDDFKRVKAAVHTLSEFFDSVQIFATRYESGSNGTVHVSYGEGNWFARYGHAKNWVLKEDEWTRNACREDK